jgi:hypothetical protein
MLILVAVVGVSKRIEMGAYRVCLTKTQKTIINLSLAVNAKVVKLNTLTAQIHGNVTHVIGKVLMNNLGSAE